MNPYRVAKFAFNLWPAYVIFGFVQWRITDLGGPWWGALSIFAAMAGIVGLIIGGLVLNAWLDARAEQWAESHSQGKESDA